METLPGEASEDVFSVPVYLFEGVFNSRSFLQHQTVLSHFNLFPSAMPFESGGIGIFWRNLLKIPGAALLH